MAATTASTARASVKEVDTRPLSSTLRTAIAATSILNLVIGLLFLFGPELKVTLWPTPISPILMRFIGSIVIANGVGAWMASRRNTWGEARILIAVALVYGAVLLPGLLYHLLFGGAASVLWGYAIVDIVFVVGIGYLFWRYENGK